MSILIRGLKMPKNCVDCPLFESKYHFHGCHAVPQSFNDMDMWNFVGDRPSWCPLTEVPKHGRLIDADALRSLYDNNAYDADGITNEEFDKMTVSVAVIRQNIDDMPTIIEAEDSVKRAKWEKHNDGIMYWWECSQCHVTVEYNEDELTNYCSHCGAKMEFIEAEGEP